MKGGDTVDQMLTLSPLRRGYVLWNCLEVSRAHMLWRNKVKNIPLESIILQSRFISHTFIACNFVLRQEILSNISD
jgi:hypothetical protein